MDTDLKRIEKLEETLYWAMIELFEQDIHAYARIERVKRRAQNYIVTNEIKPRTA